MKLPLNIDISGKYCIVAGAGGVAYRKIQKLLEYGAVVDVIAADITKQEIHTLVEQKHIRYFPKKIQNTDITLFKDAFLVVLALSDKSINTSLSTALRRQNILVNTATGSGDCDFPAVYHNDALQLSFSTGGKFPLLAVKLRDKLAEHIPTSLLTSMDLLDEYRLKAIKQISDTTTKKKFLHELIDYVLCDEHSGRIYRRELDKIFNKYL